MKTKDIAINALIAALYIALTLPFASFSFGPIQFRILEALLLLLVIDKKFSPGIIIGCLIVNIFSPLGMYDVVFGTLATMITCYAMIKTENMILKLLYPAIFNGIIVGLELTILFTNTPFIFNLITVALGEIVVVFVPGMLIKDKLLKMRNQQIF